MIDNTKRWYKIWWHVDKELAFRWKWLRDMYYWRAKK